MTNNEIIIEYPYLYETHFHTCVASACGKDTPEDMIQSCKDYGYTGVIVTDHNWGGNTCVDRSLPWDELVDQYCKSFERAKAKGDEIGVDVFFGWEAGYNGTEFLIYGLDKEWLKKNPEIREASVEQQFELVHSGGGIVIHAHPFREESYIPEIRLFPEYVDGVEGVNATHCSPLSKSHNDPLFDEKAREYAKKYNFPMTSGSDVHTVLLFGGGIRTKRKLKDIHDFTDLILSGENYVLWDGSRSYPAKM